MVILERVTCVNFDEHTGKSHLNDCQRFYAVQYLRDVLLDICEECHKMAALPQAGFAACKLRENFHDRDLIVSRMKAGDTKNMVENKKLLEYSPAKYNGKLMNSIWGFYNRYSPHNIKGNEYVVPKSDECMQQQLKSAVASSFTAMNIAVTPGSGKDNFP